MKILAALALAATLSIPALAQTTNCAAGATCNPSYSNPHLGDTNAPSSAQGTVAITSKSGNAEAQGTAIGTQINPVLDQKGAITQQPTLTQTGGPQYSASGANADGSSKADATVGPIQVAPIGTSSIGKVGGDTKTGDNQLNNASRSTSSATNKTNNASRGGDGGKGGDATGGSAAAQGGAATGGTGTGTGTAAANNGGMNVDASTHTAVQSTYDGRALVMAPVTQTIQPGITNSGNLLSISTGCLPPMNKHSQDVTAVHFGLISRSQVVVGKDDDVTPTNQDYRVVAFKDGSGRAMYYGQQLVGAMGKIGVATNKGIQAGGNQGSNFASLSGGIGSSSASEQLVGHYLVLPCSFVVEPPPAPPVVPVALAAPDNSAEIRGLHGDIDRLTALLLAHQKPAPVLKRRKSTAAHKSLGINMCWELTPSKRNSCSFHFQPDGSFKQPAAPGFIKPEVR